jgi:hypothetical protein
VIPLQRPSRRLVSIHADVVVKRQEPGASRKERLRTLAGGEIGRRTGLFVVPPIRSFDDARGEITFERLEMTALQEELSSSGRSMELVGRAASALAAIHANLDPQGTAVDHAEQVGARAVALHGDFALRNVFYMPASDQIAIIDWSNADWIGISADVGPPEIDLAVFLISLFHRRVFTPFPVARRHELARHFVWSYATASGGRMDPATIRRIVATGRPGLNRLLRHSKGYWKALIYRHSMVDLDFFLRRLCRENLPAEESTEPADLRSTR